MDDTFVARLNMSSIAGGLDVGRVGSKFNEEMAPGFHGLDQRLSALRHAAQFCPRYRLM